MKRIVTVVSVLLGIAILAAGAQALAPAAQAGPPAPTNVVFNLAGTTDLFPVSNKPQDNPGAHVFHGLEASGTVSGDFSGTFTYKENSKADTGFQPSQAAVKGDMTMTFEDGTVRVTFSGVDQLDWTYGYPIVTVVDQPWEFKNGTGRYQGIKGGGLRSSSSGCGAEFCVEYTGQMFLK